MPKELLRIFRLIEPPLQVFQRLRNVYMHKMLSFMGLE